MPLEALTFASSILSHVRFFAILGGKISEMRTQHEFPIYGGSEIAIFLFHVKDGRLGGRDIVTLTRLNGTSSAILLTLSIAS
jgi:hypothetical protein